MVQDLSNAERENRILTAMIMVNHPYASRGYKNLGDACSLILIDMRLTKKNSVLKQIYGVKTVPMKRTMNSDIEFRAIRAVCENNPVEYIHNSHTLRADYKNLDELHFLFIDAYAYTRVGRYDLAEPILTEILSRAIIDRDFFFLVHGNLLLSLCYRNDLPMAKSYLMIAEEYAREAQNTSLLAACLAYQGDYYQMQNNFKLAESLHQRVQKLLEYDEESQIKLPSLLSLANTSSSSIKYRIIV